VLVCSLDRKFAELAENDSSIYSNFYPSTTTKIFTDFEELLKTLDQKFDIVHLFCDVSPNGTIADSNGLTLAAITLVQRCSDSNVKLLWLANDNKPDGYISGFKATGKRLNLVMTLSRYGPNFSAFLRKLLSRMVGGETMPVAWVKLAPQVPGRPQQGLPDCIFHAGRGGVRLR
jgi:uncharacterized protein YerC